MPRRAVSKYIQRHHFGRLVSLCSTLGTNTLVHIGRIIARGSSSVLRICVVLWLSDGGLL